MRGLRHLDQQFDWSTPVEIFRTISESIHQTLAAERFERAGRQKGDRSGPLGAVALEGLRELVRLIDDRTGRLGPALTTIMRRMKRSKDAVVRALANLQIHGFPDWLRRWAATSATGGGAMR